MLGEVQYVWHWLRQHNRWLMVCVALYHVWHFAFGIRVPYNAGLGWDGVHYAAAVQQVYYDLPLSANDYQDSRMLPFWLAGWCFKLAAIPPTPGAIVTLFAWANLAALLACWLCWEGILNRKKVSASHSLFPALLLFGSFFVVKHIAFYPPLTDAFAYLLAFSVLLAALRGWRWALLLLLVVSGFVWPFLQLIVLVLLAFPLRAGAGQVPDAQRPLGHWKVALAAMLALLYIAVLVYWLYYRGVRLSASLNGVNAALLPLSLLAGAAFVFAAAYWMLRHTSVNYFSKELFLHGWRSLMWGVLGMIIILGTQSVGQVLASSTAEEGLKAYLTTFPVLSVVNPLCFLVAHGVFFGPLFLFVFLLWPKMALAATHHGLGAWLLLAGISLHALDPESRHLIAEWVFLCYFLLSAVSSTGIKVSPVFSISATILTLAFSRFYSVFDIPKGMLYWDEIMPNIYVANPNWQAYFMRMGPWMSTPSYYLQGALLLVAWAVLLLIARSYSIGLKRSTL